MYTRQSGAEVIKALEGNQENGLSSIQVEVRREKYGSNRLKERKEKGALQLFLEQLQDPLIYILMAAIAISLFLGEVGDAGIIAAVILLNGIVGVIQEDKARKAIEALTRLSSPRALVLRGGKEQEIPSDQLVPGDLVFLEAGRQVPADLRLLNAVNLKIEESALTGESVPVEKQTLPLMEEGSIGDQTNMAFMSTMVTSGRGEGIVTATGMETEIGRIAGMIGREKGELTPLQKRLAELGKLLSILSVGICVFCFWWQSFRKEM